MADRDFDDIAPAALREGVRRISAPVMADAPATIDTSPITAERVRQVFVAASARLAPPDDEACARLAWSINQDRESAERRTQHRQRKKTAAEIRADEINDELRAAIRIIQEHDKHIKEGLAAQQFPAGGEHAASVLRLCAAAAEVAGWWPRLDARLPNFNLKTWLRRLPADRLAWRALRVWREANPGKIIGKPLAADQPATRLICGLLRLVDIEIDPGTLARDLARRKA